VPARRVELPTLALRKRTPTNESPWRTVRQGIDGLPSAQRAVDLRDLGDEALCRQGAPAQMALEGIVGDANRPVSSAAMTQALLLCIVLCLIRGLYLRILVERHEAIYSTTSGVLTTELRRKVHLVAHADGMGGLTFPKPRETRTLVHGVAGLPVWHEVQSVGLPQRVERTINSVTAQEFDAHFSRRFRWKEASPVRQVTVGAHSIKQPFAGVGAGPARSGVPNVARLARTPSQCTDQFGDEHGRRSQQARPPG
jgi:hypothetical protein